MKRQLATIALLLCSSPSSAQSSFIAGQVVDGQINVQVNATLSDARAGSYPAANLPLTLHLNATDSVMLRTDDAGVLQFRMRPGLYRLASAPVRWEGREYQWNVPLRVEPRMNAIDLTPDNAGVGPGSAASNAGGSSPAPVSGVRWGRVVTSPAATPAQASPKPQPAVAPLAPAPERAPADTPRVKWGRVVKPPTS